MGDAAASDSLRYKLIGCKPNTFDVTIDTEAGTFKLVHHGPQKTVGTVTIIGTATLKAEGVWALAETGKPRNLTLEVGTPGKERLLNFVGEELAGPDPEFECDY
eukprot:Hpha_TRINITY_DN34210_c0_g1::TRINITY_DN34210_c0_g1_i1::g.34386::m.34386